MVEFQPSKLAVWVRSPSPAPCCLWGYGGIGRRNGLKIRRPLTAIRVRVSISPPFFCLLYGLDAPSAIFRSQRGLYLPRRLFQLRLCVALRLCCLAIQVLLVIYRYRIRSMFYWG